MLCSPSVPPSLVADAGEAQGFIKFFKSMEENQSRTIRFFWRKKDTGFYTCHGDDALFVAQECFHTMSVVKVNTVCLHSRFVVDVADLACGGTSILERTMSWLRWRFPMPTSTVLCGSS